MTTMQRKDHMIFYRRYRMALLTLLFFIAASAAQAGEVLTWDACVNEALLNQPDLLSSRASIDEAGATRRITASSGLPQVQAGLSATQSGTTEGSGSSSSSFSYWLSASQLLYDGGSTSSLIAGADESINAARYRYGTVSSEVRFALRTAFVDLLKAQELVGLAGEIAERRKKNVRLLQLRYNAGREHIGSLRRAEADMAEAAFEVAQAERALVLARSKLASALGRDQRSVVNVKGSFKASESLVSTPQFSVLARQNPQVQQLQAVERSARHDLDASRHAFAPALSLTSSVGRNSFDQLPVDALDWNAGFSVSIPIFEGGSGRANVAKALAALNNKAGQEQSGYLQVLDTLEESWKNFQDASENVGVQKKFLEAAAERSTIANAQYSNGLISFDDWVIIEDNLVSSKKSYLNAEAELLLAEAQWMKAKGVTLHE